MKRILPALAAAFLLFLCACGRQPQPTAVSEAFHTPAGAAESSSAPTEVTLSPGASEQVRRAECFGRGPDGALYTGLSRADGLVCLYDVLPEDIGYISRFLMTDEGIYAAVKSEYFTLDPAELWFWPADGGEAQLLAEDVSSDGAFVMTEDELFYTDAETGSLRRAGAADETGLSESVRLLDADAGFIYYAKDDGVYRNDSTLGAEAKLFEPALLTVRAGGGRLYDLSFRDGAAALELREKDGSLSASVPLAEGTDNYAYADGRLYVPQPAQDTILILDAATGGELGALPLLDGGTYCLLQYAGEDAVYYETVLDGEVVLCRTGPDGAESLGPELLYQ